MNMRELLLPGRWLSEHGGPRYRQLQRVLEEVISSGELAPGTPLPSERELAEITTLSRVTVRKAIRPLVEAGLIVQRRGSGSVVAGRVSRVEQMLSRLTSFTEDMARRGLQSHSTWIERGMFTPSPEEMVVLGLSPGEQVARIARLRHAGGEPMAIERASLPPDILPDPDRVEKSLYKTLAANGNRPVRALQRLSAISLGAEDAALLGAFCGAAALHVERTSYLPGGRVVEFTRSLYRGDAYDFVAELRIPEREGNTGDTAT